MHSYLSDKWIKASVLSLWALMTLTTVARIGQTQQYVALEEVSRIEGCRHAVADYDLDGIDEVLTLTCDHRNVLLYNADFGIFRVVWHMHRIKGEFCWVEAHDIVGNKTPEIFVSVKRGDTAWVQVFNAKRDLLKETVPVTGCDRRGDSTWDGFIDKFNIIDIDGDGQKDILAAVNSGYDLTPRGVYAYDWETTSLLWNYPIACSITRMVTVDLDGNGTEEIILSTGAPSNGYAIDGMDDAHSYIIVLDRNGNLQWRQQTSGKFFSSWIETEDFDQDGLIEIINNYASGDVDDPNAMFQLQIRNGQTGLVQKYFPLSSSSPGGFILEDLNRDGVKEIIAGGDNGILRIFNRKLELLHEMKYGSSLTPIAVEDINLDGEPEILAQSRAGLKILDSKLQISGEHKLDRPVRLGRYLRNPFQKGAFLIVEGTSEDAFVVLYKFKFSKTPFLPDPLVKWRDTPVYPVVFFLFGLLIGILVWVVTPTLRKRIKVYWTRGSDLSSRREALLESLSVFGHGQLPTSNLDRLTLLFKNVPSQESMYPTYSQKLHETLDTYRNLTNKRLQDIEKRSVEAHISRIHVNTLRTHIQHMGKLVSKLQSHQLDIYIIQHMSKEVSTLCEELEKDVKCIMTELSAYLNCDVLTAVQKVVTAAEEEMTKSGITFKDLTIRGHIGGRGFIRENELVAIVEDLVSNAIKALGQSSQKEIWIEIVTEDRKISMKVNDTGCGIQEENIPKIFDRDFTTKGDGGFGLYYAKTTVSKYGGNIRVLETQVGTGTTMQIELKRVG